MLGIGLKAGWVLGAACAALFSTERDVLARCLLIPANHEPGHVVPMEGEWVLPCVDPTFLWKGKYAALLRPTGHPILIEPEQVAAEDLPQDAGSIEVWVAVDVYAGPRWVSADGRNEVVLEGLFQVNGSVVDEGRSPRATLGLERMRPELAGRFADSLHFRVEPNFSAHEVELEEAWIGMEVLSLHGLLMAGRMKVPFGLEEVRSRRHINFTRFSILNQFSPAEEHGLFLNGKSNSGRWEYGMSATDGVESGDSDASVNLAARIMLHPGAQEPASRWRNLQLGLAATTGSLDAEAKGLSVENAAGQDVIRMADDVLFDGNRTRIGFEAAWFDGPWFVQAEHMLVEQDMSVGGDAANVDFTGSYLEVARVLTGESKSFKGVSPDQPFDPATGSGRGAWVLAARVSELHSDDRLQGGGLAMTGTYTSAIRNISLGLNWVMNDHMILRQALVRSFYSDDVLVDGEPRDGESALLFGLQLHF